MSRNPEPPDFGPVPLSLSGSNTTSPQSMWPTSLADPFDTPLFNRLISLIEKQTATLEEQRAVMEEQRDVMKDMRRALDARQFAEHVDVRSTPGPNHPGHRGLITRVKRRLQIALKASEFLH
ncbi:hypothetical protein SISSUDRAFT_1054535 [Sistotremastrum suecicum HHB10207 ss-3]|uniref:Uncharacterized protein n=1 Tax=Sistotremastrum suecicum HHB10207 ss-3 TaxID=1314776 RepID=A0A165YG57_9AGAM|nr:hypothetical protein SISSUDRAFT_1054535 [Sistotremastrum suecicum HHB10207 ss-3]